MTRSGIALVALALALVLPASAPARPGDLDESFSRDGLVVQGAPDAVIEAEVAPDGSVLVAENSAGNGIVRHFTVGGEEDQLYAEDTAGTLALGNGGSAAAAIDVRESGRIVLGGRSNASGFNDFAVAELLANGAPFCVGSPPCPVITDFAGGSDRLTDVFAEASGATLAAGIVTDGSGAHLGVARYGPDGALDSSFSGDGRLIFDSGGIATLGRRALVAGLADGSVLLAGTGPGPDGTGAGDLLLAKLEPDGDLDPAFAGGDGWVTVDVAGRDEAGSLVVDQGGGIIVGIDACAFGLTTECNGAIARFTPSGQLDPEFGSGGVVTNPAGSRVVLGPAGTVYAAGTVGPREHFGNDFALARYTNAGTPDPGFSGDGVATADFGLSHDAAVSAAAGPDGRVVLAGYVGGEFTRLGLARFEVAEGPPDADADRVLDDEDRCPERFGRGRSGCPGIDRELVLRDAGGRLEVRLGSDLSDCAARQRINVIRAGSGSIARPRTDRRGRWRSAKPVPDGVYRAKVKRRFAPDGLGRCAGARSRVTRVG